MRHILIGLLLAGGVDAAARTHTVGVRVSDGKNVYAKALNVKEGVRSDFTDLLPAAGGAPARFMTANVLLNRDGEFAIQYKVELFGGEGSKEPSIRGQGEFFLGPGKSATVLECGTWNVEIGLDQAGGAGGKRKKTARPATGAGNYRLTTEISKGGLLKAVCRQLGGRSTQNDAAAGGSEGEKRSGLIVNTLVSEAREKDEPLDLQYQVGYTPASGEEAIQAQGGIPLTPGRKAAVKAGGYLLEFLVEGVKTPPAKAAAAVP